MLYSTVIVRLMKWRFGAPIFFLLLGHVLLPNAMSGQTALGVQLLTNPSFEIGPSGLTGWTAVSGTAAAVPYGAGTGPGTAVGTTIGGATNANYLRDQSGFAIVEQIVPLSMLPSGAVVHVSGYCGGENSDSSRMIVRFLGAGGTVLGQQFLESCTDLDRNFEAVLMLRDGRVAVPPGALSVALRIEFQNNCCSIVGGAADMMFLEVVTGGVLPPAQPMNAELLTNPGFEQGWAPVSPLSINSIQSWRGRTGGGVDVVPYASSAAVPAAFVSCAIAGGPPSPACAFGGAGNILTDRNAGAVFQRIDVRGNAAQLAAPGGLVLRLSAYLGGTATTQDDARVEVQFLNANLVSVAPVGSLGPVSQANRNFETVVMFREADFPIPAATEFIDVDVIFGNACCSVTEGLADNISARLILPTTPTGVPLNTNLCANGSFSVGSLAGSPLILTTQNAWFGVGSSSTSVVGYGTSGILPSTGFATANALGSLLARDNGGSTLRQIVDLSADAALINAGRYFVGASAWLGGIGTDSDSAELRISFIGFNGGLVPSPGALQVLGPVTPAMRGNVTTLILQSSTFQIPVGTVQMVIDLQFNNFCCSSANGLADEINVYVWDTLVGGPSLLPGTNEGLRLFTGVNGPPTTGPGNDSKTASGNDVLNVRIESLGGTFDFAPLVLVANARPNGTLLPPSPSTIPSGLAFDPFANGSFFVLNGVNCFTFGCPAVLPGGTNMNFLVPPGATGFIVVLQAAVVPIPGFGIPIPANGLFAASDGHQIIL